MRLFRKAERPPEKAAPAPVRSLRLPQVPLVLETQQTRVILDTLRGTSWTRASTDTLSLGSDEVRGCSSHAGEVTMLPPSPSGALADDVTTPLWHGDVPESNIGADFPDAILQPVPSAGVPEGNLLLTEQNMTADPSQTVPPARPEERLPGILDEVLNLAACDSMFEDRESFFLQQPFSVEALADLDRQWSPDESRAVVTHLFGQCPLPGSARDEQRDCVTPTGTMGDDHSET